MPPVRQTPIKYPSVGARFGRLTVVRQATTGVATWICACDCGTEKSALASSLSEGRVRSCGCRKGRGALSHGGHGELLYSVWCRMRDRCRRPSGRSWHLYGGKGIRVCPEWDDYAAFRAWALEAGYRPGLTIERKNGDGGYCPANCTWATRAAQSRNTTRNLKAPTGELWSDIAAQNGIRSGTFKGRRRRGWPAAAAATLPLNAIWSAYQ